MADVSQVAVDVWFWSLDVEPDEFTALAGLLSGDEAMRAERFFQAHDRRRWTVARARMRQLLGRAINRPPSAISFSTEPNGRPFLSDAPSSLSFNLSHAEGVGALAVSFDARVGVDVEAVRPMTDAEMAWPLSAAERAAMAGVQGQERFEAFFRFWTLKEAFIKAVGTGLSLPLEDFDMSAPGAEPRLMRLAGAPEEPDRWRFAEHRPGAGHRAAVAALAEGRQLRVQWHGLCLGEAF